MLLKKLSKIPIYLSKKHLLIFLISLIILARRNIFSIPFSFRKLSIISISLSLISVFLNSFVNTGMIGFIFSYGKSSIGSKAFF